MSVYTSPPELLAAIFSYACTDTGTTGFALNLVCKTFHEICRNTSVDIQCAAVCGVQRMEQFLQMLSRRTESKRKVVFLFLSYRDVHHMRWLDDRYDVTVAAFPETRNMIVRLMLDVLHAVNLSHLEVLHADYPEIWASSVFTSPLALLNLVELRIIGNVVTSSLSEMHITPALEKLCISGPFLCCVRPHGPHGETRKEAFGAMLKRACPRLTHLRFTPPISPPLGETHFDFVHAYCRVSRSPRDITSSLPPLVGGVEPSHRHGDGAASGRFVRVGDDSDVDMPAQLRRIIVDRPPCIPDIHYLSAVVNHFPLEGVWYPDHFTVLKGYRALALEAKKETGVGDEEHAGQRSLKILPALPYVRRENRTQYALEEFLRLKMEWLNRVAGRGPGLWV